MMTLQNPVKARCDAMINHIKDVTKAQKAFGKTLDKVHRALPSTSHPVKANPSDPSPP